jgi:hypothetical protein
MGRDLMRMEQAYRANVGVGAELAAAQRILDADIERKEHLEDEIDALAKDLRETRRNLCFGVGHTDTNISLRCSLNWFPIDFF